MHIYTQTIHRTIQLTTLVGRLSGIRTQIGQTNWEECGPFPVFASYTLAFALQLRKKHGKTSVRVEHGKISVRVEHGKTSVRLEHGKTSVRIKKNLNQGRKTSVRILH